MNIPSQLILVLLNGNGEGKKDVHLLISLKHVSI